MKRKYTLFHLLSFTWGILWTLVGLFVLAFVYLFMRNKVLIYPVAGRIAIVFKEYRGPSASLGIVYMVNSGNNIKTHMHEIGHTVQNIILGPLFILLVAIPSGIRCQLWPLIRKNYYKKHNRYPDYYGIWFESQANYFGSYFEDEVVSSVRPLR